MNYSKVFIGIDIGKTGFITILMDGKYRNIPIPIDGSVVDINKMRSILDTIPDKENSHCVIEDLHAVFGSSAKATFAFGHINGVVEAVLSVLEIPYTKVQPKKWQKEMWEGIPIQYKSSSTGKTKVVDTKATSLIAAKRLFPGMDFTKTERSKKPDHNLVDAMLLCEYCKRNF